MKKYQFLVLFGTIFIMSLGCSGGGGNVITPLPQEKSFDQTFNKIPVGVSDYSSDGYPMSGTGTLGMFSISVDPKTLQGEIVP